MRTITVPGEMAYQARAHVLREFPGSGPSWPGAPKAAKGPQWLAGSLHFMRKIPSELCCSVGSRSEVNTEAGDPTGLRQTIHWGSGWPDTEKLYVATCQSVTSKLRSLPKGRFRQIIFVERICSIVYVPE